MHPVQAREMGGRFETLSNEATARLNKTAMMIANEFGIYRREFRAPKR